MVLANGAEGEPASGKDRLLLTRLPHLVMDGMTLAADAVGAREAILCVHRQESGLMASLRQAAEERRRAGTDPVPIEIAGIPGRYVSSEQSSIVQYLNGGPGKPTFSPPRPHERGVHLAREHRELLMAGRLQIGPRIRPGGQEASVSSSSSLPLVPHPLGRAAEKVRWHGTLG